MVQINLIVYVFTLSAVKVFILPQKLLSTVSIYFVEKGSYFSYSTSLIHAKYTGLLLTFPKFPCLREYDRSFLPVLVSVVSPMLECYHPEQPNMTGHWAVVDTDMTG